MKTPGLRHLALAVDDFSAAYAELQAKGVNFAGEPQESKGNKVVFFTDPEGNYLPPPATRNAARVIRSPLPKRRILAQQVEVQPVLGERNPGRRLVIHAGDEAASAISGNRRSNSARIAASPLFMTILS